LGKSCAVASWCRRHRQTLRERNVQPLRGRNSLKRYHS
jgi:hypothetical protein